MSLLCHFLWRLLSGIAYFNRDKTETGQVKSYRSLAVFSVCSSLFILYEERSRDFIRLLLYMMLAAFIVCMPSLLGTANHLIISLDIVVFFSILIVVRYHNLKVSYNLL